MREYTGMIDSKSITDNAKKYGSLKLAMTLFIVFPILFLIYLYMSTTMIGGDLVGAISEDPMLNIAFIIAMINPFCGYLCKVILKDIDEGKDKEVIKINLLILTIAQVFVFNIVGVILLSITLYRNFKWNSISKKHIVGIINNKYAISRVASSSSIFLIYLMCLFITLKLK
ncbi:hypothetical protein [Clostridium sardiniense]|uniref:hypothetical protein n=1 Tax=Clostridium sardiniense TaxID=29369 RepID=UPI003D354AEF